MRPWFPYNCELCWNRRTEQMHPKSGNCHKLLVIFFSFGSPRFENHRRSVRQSNRLTTWARFIERKILISNRENIEIHYINLDVFSIGIELFAFNEPGSDGSNRVSYTSNPNKFRAATMDVVSMEWFCLVAADRSRALFCSIHFRSYSFYHVQL